MSVALSCYTVGMESVATRVYRGVQWLDKHQPGWEKYVGTHLLQMNNPCRCVLGQAFLYEAMVHNRTNGYSFGLLLALNDGAEAVLSKWAISHGFDAIKTEQEDEDYENLREFWTRVIRSRLPLVATI